MKSQDLAFEAYVVSGEAGTFDKTLGITGSRERRFWKGS